MTFNELILSNLRPNFFEMVAQEAMHEALRPAFEYVCKVLSHTRPGVFGPLWRLRDELYLLLETAVQQFFLRGYDASFSEYFYCLKRVSSRGGGGGGGGGGRGGGGGGGGGGDGGGGRGEGERRLQTKGRLLSLLCLVFIPYLKVKMERLYSRLTDEDDVMQLSWSRDQSAKQLLKVLLFKATPYLQSLWSACMFVFHLQYLISRSAHYSPLHWLAGVEIIRQTQEEMSSSTSLSMWRTLAGHLFSLALFSLKMLEWWHSGERATAVKMMSSLPVPPPPPPIPPSQDGLTLPSNPRLCPLCHQARDEPAALTTSGYVFCYKCISDYLRTVEQCPVTLIPTSHKQIVKLFIEQQT